MQIALGQSACSARPATPSTSSGPQWQARATMPIPQPRPLRPISTPIQTRHLQASMEHTLPTAISTRRTAASAWKASVLWAGQYEHLLCLPRWSILETHRGRNIRCTIYRHMTSGLRSFSCSWDCNCCRQPATIRKTPLVSQSYTLSITRYLFVLGPTQWSRTHQIQNKKCCCHRCTFNF